MPHEDGNYSIEEQHGPDKLRAQITEAEAATLAGLREGKLVAVPREVDEAIFKKACQLAGCFPDSVMGVHGRCLVIAYLAAAQDRTP